MNFTKEQIDLLITTYFQYFPEDIPEEVLKDYKKIIENKYLFRSSVPNNLVLDSVLDIAVDKVSSKKPFQKEFLLRVILNNKGNTPTEAQRDKLFYLFSHLVLTAKESIEWKVTRLIKDIELSGEHIQWLIENARLSNHIQNRLLRYPSRNIAISLWADVCLQEDMLPDRLSELLALKLNFDQKVTHTNTEALLWAVYYSKLEDDAKKALLKKHFSERSLESFISICEKSKYFDLIKELMEKAYSEIPS